MVILKESCNIMNIMMSTLERSVYRNGSFSLLVLVMGGCFQEPQYPNVPKIDFKGFSRYALATGTGVGQSKRDSLIITIGFKDGDGDLGNDLPIGSNDLTRYMQAGGWGNYKIRTFRLENNHYKEQTSGENNFLTFPRLESGDIKRPIEGNLEFKQVYTYGRLLKIYPTKYRIQIRDRMLNISNEIETDTIHLPYPN